MDRRPCVSEGLARPGGFAAPSADGLAARLERPGAARWSRGSLSWTTLERKIQQRENRNTAIENKHSVAGDGSRCAGSMVDSSGAGSARSGVGGRRSRKVKVLLEVHRSIARPRRRSSNLAPLPREKTGLPR